MYSTICPYTRYNLISQNSTCCVTPQHVMTRYLAHAFWYRKKVVLCRACCTASATRPSQRARQARYSTQLTREHCCFFVVRHVGTSTAQQARHSTSRHVTTRTTRRARRVVTCRDVTQQVEFGPYSVKETQKFVDTVIILTIACIFMH